jgi:serine/threonine protein phosphatase PrpC
MMMRAFELSVSSALVGQGPQANDMRLIVDHRIGLYCVADGSGPTYGGYHPPLGLEQGLAVFTSKLSGSSSEKSVGVMRAALEDTHAAMRSLAAQANNDQSLGHYYGQLTACWFVSADRLIVGQVGTCRVYRRRGVVCEQLVEDQSIATLAAKRGESAPHFFRDPGVMLGADPCDLLVESFDVQPGGGPSPRVVQPGDRFLLCTVDAVGYAPVDDASELIDMVLDEQKRPMLEQALTQSPHGAALLCLEA